MTKGLTREEHSGGGRGALCIPAGPNTSYVEHVNLTSLDQKGWDTFPLYSQLCVPPTWQTLSHPGNVEQGPFWSSDPTAGGPGQHSQLDRSLLPRVGSLVRVVAVPQGWTWACRSHGCMQGTVTALGERALG